MKKNKRKPHKKLPDLNYLKSNYKYDPIKGLLFKRNTSKQVGYKDKRGYCHVRILKQTYKLHRIVYFMYYCVDPGKKVIDHIDGDKSNNAILNLRCVTHRENCNNTAEARANGIVPKLEPNAWRVLLQPVSST